MLLNFLFVVDPYVKYVYTSAKCGQSKVSKTQYHGTLGVSISDKFVLLYQNCGYFFSLYKTLSENTKNNALGCLNHVAVRYTFLTKKGYSANA